MGWGRYLGILFFCVGVCGLFVFATVGGYGHHLDRENGIGNWSDRLWSYDEDKKIEGVSNNSTIKINISSNRELEKMNISNTSRSIDFSSGGKIYRYIDIPFSLPGFISDKIYTWNRNELENFNTTSVTSKYPSKVDLDEFGGSFGDSHITVELGHDGYTKIFTVKNSVINHTGGRKYILPEQGRVLGIADARIANPNKRHGYHVHDRKPNPLEENGPDKLPCHRWWTINKQSIGEIKTNLYINREKEGDSIGSPYSIKYNYLVNDSKKIKLKVKTKIEVRATQFTESIIKCEDNHCACVISDREDSLEDTLEEYLYRKGYNSSQINDLEKRLKQSMCPGCTQTQTSYFVVSDTLKGQTTNTTPTDITVYNRREDPEMEIDKGSFVVINGSQWISINADNGNIESQYSYFTARNRSWDVMEVSKTLDKNSVFGYLEDLFEDVLSDKTDIHPLELHVYPSSSRAIGFPTTGFVGGGVGFRDRGNPRPSYRHYSKTLYNEKEKVSVSLGDNIKLPDASSYLNKKRVLTLDFQMKNIEAVYDVTGSEKRYNVSYKKALQPQIFIDGTRVNDSYAYAEVMFRYLNGSSINMSEIAGKIYVNSEAYNASNVSGGSLNVTGISTDYVNVTYTPKDWWNRSIPAVDGEVEKEVLSRNIKLEDFSYIVSMFFLIVVPVSFMYWLFRKVIK